MRMTAIFPISVSHLLRPYGDGIFLTHRLLSRGMIWYSDDQNIGDYACWEYLPYHWLTSFWSTGMSIYNQLFWRVIKWLNSFSAHMPHGFSGSFYRICHLFCVLLGTKEHVRSFWHCMKMIELIVDIHSFIPLQLQLNFLAVIPHCRYISYSRISHTIPWLDLAIINRLMSVCVCVMIFCACMGDWVLGSSSHLLSTVRHGNGCSEMSCEIPNELRCLWLDHMRDNGVLIKWRREKPGTPLPTFIQV